MKILLKQIKDNSGRNKYCHFSLLYYKMTEQNQIIIAIKLHFLSLNLFILIPLSEFRTEDDTNIIKL